VPTPPVLAADPTGAGVSVVASPHGAG